MWAGNLPTKAREIADIFGDYDAVFGLGGKSLILYELHVTNFGRTDLTLERIEVLDETGTVIAKYEDQALTGILARSGVTVTDARDRRGAARGRVSRRGGPHRVN